MRVVLLMGWRSERFVEPGHQIAVGQESHAQEGHQIGQAPAETGGHLQVAQQRKPDIRVSQLFKKPLFGSVYIRAFQACISSGQLRTSSEVTDEPSKLARFHFEDGV